MDEQTRADLQKELAIRDKPFYIELARREYQGYCNYVHEGRWVKARHLIYLCNTVQNFLEKKSDSPYDILIVQMPPQHGKSMTLTETLPSWYLGKYPHNRVIEISYNDDFAQQFGRRNKDKINQFGEEIFGLELAKRPCTDTNFELSNHVGGMISRGCMSGVTGQPCNLMIIDDPIKNRQEADSQTYRDRVWEEWLNSYKTRFAAHAKVIVIMTRWHEDDLAGRIINNEDNVTTINLPCEAEYNDTLGRKPGEALFPEIGKDDNWLKQFKRGYQTTDGSRAWNALYQGHPTCQVGNLIKREWWQYYDELPPQFEVMVQTWDCAFKDGDDNDFVAGQVWGKLHGNYYLVDRVKDHLNFTGTIKAIEKMTMKYPQALIKLIEDKANGSAVIQILKIKTPGIIPINPEGGKIARVNAISPAIESGNVYLPKKAKWLNEFVDECSVFPNGKHDDEVDAMSQGLNRLIYFSGTLPTVPVSSMPFWMRTNDDINNNGGDEYISWDN